MAISATTGVTASNATAGTSLASPSFSATALQSIVVGIALANTSSSVSGIVDTATTSNTYTLQSAVTNSSGVRIELWAATGITAKTGNVVTVSLTASSLMAIAVEEYAGAVSTYVGHTSSGTGSGYSPVTSLTIQDSGNFLIAAMGFVCNSGDTITAFEGTLIQSVVPALTSVGVALVDSTSLGDGVLPASMSLSTSRQWAAAGLELRTHNANATYVEYAGPIPFPFGSINDGFIINIGLNAYIMPLRDAAPLTLAPGNSAY